MPTGAKGSTYEYYLTEEDMKGDLDMIPLEWLLPNVEVYEQLEEDDEDKDMDFVNLYKSADDAGDISEGSDDGVTVKMWRLSRDTAENCFPASIQEIEEPLLGWARTRKDFFSYPEEQNKKIQGILSKRRGFLAGNTRLLVDLAAVREDALEERINFVQLDNIDRKMDRLTLLNVATQQFLRCVNKES
ncbi:hypothetical protein HOY80DRAFT_1001096 [Tuber brumale]|nr:hypothetical protein HOY80DRAFT_1001096 [Tuber brumale]